MREHDDYYNDENIRLYTPVLQRVIILAAVIIAVPVMMWTITTFVRGYIARPKVPALEHVASTSLPGRIPAISPSPPSATPSPADQSASQRIDGTSASDATSPAADTRNGPPNLALAPDAGASPPTNSPSGVSLRTAPTPAPSSAITTATTTGDISTGSTLPAPPSPRPSLAPRSNDNTASTGAPSSSDRGLAWPNPNTTSPPDFAAPRLPPLPAPAPPAARTAAAEVLPAEEPIRGPIPMPRQRPGTFAVAAVATGPVPLPRARPAAAPAETANTAAEPVSGYRPGLESDR